MMEIAGEEHQQWQGVRLVFGAPVGVLHQQAQSRHNHLQSPKQSKRKN
jgi:hypothetical protein